jgi:hypothetical protein
MEGKLTLLCRIGRGFMDDGRKTLLASVHP